MIGRIRIPAWWRIFRSAIEGLLKVHGGMIAASVAFYAFFSIAPALSASIGVWALLADPHYFADQIAVATSGLPREAAQLLNQQAWRMVERVQSGAGLAAVVGFLLALYSANQATKALIEGINIVYNRTESRGFVRFNLTSLALTLLLVVGVTAALGVIVVLPVAFALVGLESQSSAFTTILRWPLLLAAVMAALAIVYRWAPSPGGSAPPRRVGLAVVAAAALWLLASMAFSFYVSHFGAYGAAYGSFGAIIMLMTWLWLSAFVVLLGAELNAKADRTAASGEIDVIELARRRLRRPAGAQPGADDGRARS